LETVKRNSKGEMPQVYANEEHTSTIEKLFINLQEDDFESFSKALSPIRRQIIKLAQQRLHDDDVEDVVQQTLSVFWEKRRSVQKPEYLMSCLFSILRNKVGDVYRRRDRQKKYLVGSNKQVDAVADPSGSNPERLYEGKELERILKEAIEICAAENQLWGKVLQLLKDGRTRDEICRELGNIPIATVYSRIYRARQHLIKILRDEFGVEI
jgi:RNA polymerase sigma factor (sigma-70 family)